MKYQCADGVNRDRAIARYLKLYALVQEKEKGIARLRKEVSHLLNEMNEIAELKLGKVGMKALKDHIR